MTTPKIISTNTPVALGFVVGGIATLVGAVFWFTTLYSTASANKDAIEALNTRLEVIEEVNQDTRERMVRIETKLDTLIENVLTPNQ